MALAGCGGGSKDIHGAAFDGDLARVKKLVAGGVDINKRGKKKVTALHIAAYQGNNRHIALAKWMLANGADTGARDFEGKTPLQVANDRGNTKSPSSFRADAPGAEVGN